MKKINVKIISIALIILSVLVTGGIAASVKAPSGVSQGEQGSGGGG